MTQASEVITAVETILTNAGHTVVLFRQVDDDLDDLPVVSVRFGENGSRGFGDGRPPQKEADIDIVWVGTVNADHEIEALEKAEEIEDLLVPFTQDRPTVIGGARVTHKTTNVETREHHSDTIASIVTINAKWSRS